MRALHFVFRASGSQVPFSSREHYVFFWNQLRSRLNRCLALCLMPNHGHLLVQVEDRGIAEKAIRLSLLTFKRKNRSFWDPVPEPTVIPDLKHLRRQIRYVHLNPCRSDLTRDPLCWEFSTHWDFLGYTVGPIFVPTVQSLGLSTASLFHEYISSDLSTQVTGTPLLHGLLSESEFPIVTLDRVADLACVLTRSSPISLKRSGITRRLFYTLAVAAGYKNKTQIARYLNISQQSVAEWVARGRALEYPRVQARRLLCDPRMNSNILIESQEMHKISKKTAKIL